MNGKIIDWIALLRAFRDGWGELFRSQDIVKTGFVFDIQHDKTDAVGQGNSTSHFSDHF